MPFLEERVEALEEENRQLRADMAEIKRYGFTQYATPKQLAEMMHCTVQTIHRKIKDGEIAATYKLGDPKIPLGQFYDPPKPAKIKKKKSEAPLSIAEQVFGSEAAQ